MPEKKRIITVSASKALSSDLEFSTVLNASEYDIETVSSGNLALALIKEKGCDLVLAELRLPDLSGTELLKTVSEICPNAIRVLICEASQKDEAIKGAAYVHRNVVLPIDVAGVRNLLKNVFGLRTLLPNDSICRRIASVSTLPSPPAMYEQIVAELRSDRASVRRIATLVGKDVGIAAKILQLVNSAYFGLPFQVESIARAIDLLGLNAVQDIVLAAGVFTQFHNPKMKGISVDDVYRRGIDVGAKARLIANCVGLSAREVEESLTAGLLHDVGKLLMMTRFEKELAESMALSERGGMSLDAAQQQVIGASDAQMGAYLLSVWGIAVPIVEAVALHSAPEKAQTVAFTPLTAVHLAWAFDRDERNRCRDERDSALDFAYLRRLNLDSQVPQLRGLCSSAVAS
jgi:HD-like signal output (HDOD) protein